MKSKTIAILSAVLMLAVGTLAPATAWAATPDANWLPEVVDSAELTSPIVISGTIHDLKGSAFESGTHVVLYAYPASEVIESMGVGDSITVEPVAKAEVSEQGAFELRIADVSALARYASKAGSIDFEVRAVTGTSYAPYSFSRTLSGSGSDARLALADSVQIGGSQLSADLAATETPVSIISLPENPALSVANVDNGTIEKTDVCGETLVSNLGSKKVTVGATYTTVAGTSAKYVYSSGSNSTLTVGYSTTGAYGSFSQSGSILKASTATVDFGTRSGSYVYSTYFRYGKYSQWCYPIGQPSLKTIYAYIVKANQFDGGSVVGASSAPAATYCSPFAGNTTLTRDSSTAYNWTTGAALSTAIGINLASQTGYTGTAKLVYSNTSSTSRQVCGTNGTWGSTPKRVVAKA